MFCSACHLLRHDKEHHFMNDAKKALTAAAAAALAVGSIVYIMLACFQSENGQDRWFENLGV